MQTSPSLIHVADAIDILVHKGSVVDNEFITRNAEFTLFREQPSDSLIVHRVISALAKVFLVFPRLFFVLGNIALHVRRIVLVIVFV